MKNNTYRNLTSTLILLAACDGAYRDDLSEGAIERIGELTLQSENALNLNALNLNALNLNALNLNALNAESLDSSALTAIRSPGDKGDLARQLVRYAVGCALTASQSFAFSWTDAQGQVHEERYFGQLGLAPTWATGPLTAKGERWVSACLASRVNYYGIPVLISSRAPGALVTADSERSAYTWEEGAFWGTLFGSAPAVYSCYSPLTTSHSRALSRVCAAGHVDDDGLVQDCGRIRIVGPCTLSCALPLLNGDGYYNCSSSLLGSRIKEVMTIFLQ
jgi:hypothetical protein